jgi:DNA gyrase/topoisomerase IV subunit B
MAQKKPAIEYSFMIEITSAQNKIEVIRKRPGMYIGSLDFSGFKMMLEYLLDEIILETDERMILRFELHKLNHLRIEVSGIDTERIKNKLSKPDDTKFESFAFSVLIALSAELKIEINNSDSIHTLLGKNGNYNSSLSKIASDKNNVIIDFIPDFEIFTKFEIRYEQLNYFIRKFSFLNSYVKIISIDNTGEFQQQVFPFEEGVKDQLDFILAQQKFGQPEFRLDLKMKLLAYDFQISFCYSYVMGLNADGSQSNLKSYAQSYANHWETYFGGTLVQAIFRGINLAVRKIAGNEKLKLREKIEEKILENLILIAAVKGKSFDFESATHRKLGTSDFVRDLEKYICEQVVVFMDAYPAEKKRMMEKFIRR